MAVRPAETAHAPWGLQIWMRSLLAKEQCCAWGAGLLPGGRGCYPA